MDSDLTTINTIGPATAKALIAAGIPDAATLRRVGAHDAYRAMLVAGSKPHFIWYYVLVMALQGGPGTIAGARKRPCYANGSIRWWPRCAASLCRGSRRNWT
ncbi:TfoX/Sxy family DNA transformation protein [Paracoccus sp. SY]|uniref:TfoX/Sxy family DNA transformation protein n=1 Tax=Paracoccus sp. SY TaxID=1330255 RepID=UPI00352B0FFC